MKMNEVLSMLLESPEELKPIVEQAKKVIDLYAPEIQTLLKRINATIREMKVDSILYYEKQGFTRHEALLLVLDQWQVIAESLKNRNKK